MHKKHTVLSKASFKKYSSPNIYIVTILHGCITFITYCLTVLAILHMQVTDTVNYEDYSSIINIIISGI